TRLLQLSRQPPAAPRPRSSCCVGASARTMPASCWMGPLAISRSCSPPGARRALPRSEDLAARRAGWRPRCGRGADRRRAHHLGRSGRATAATGARVLGARIGGPFLNPSFRGAHLRSHLADPTPENVDVILAARPRLVTIAPELPGALAAVERLHGAGVVVAAGHTGADFE